MAVVLGLDIGTTPITSLAIDGDTGESLGAKTTTNDSRLTGSPRGGVNLMRNAFGFRQYAVSMQFPNCSVIEHQKLSGLG